MNESFELEILNPYEDAKKTYKDNKAVLTLKQKLLFIRYLLVLKTYDNLRKSLTFEELNSIYVDDLLISIKERSLTKRILNYFSEKKFNETKELVNKEITRIKDFLDKFYRYGENYKSNYSNDKIEKILSNESDKALTIVLSANEMFKEERISPKKRNM